MNVLTMNINTIITENGKRYAVTDTGERYVVQTNNKGEDYVYIDNPKEVNGSFNGRIGDAVEAIHRGEGDAVEVNNFFGSRIILVVYFLDRTVGATYREKSLEGWKNSVFKWCITCGKKTSQRNYMPLTSKYDFIHYGFKQEGEPAIFDTIADAECFYGTFIDTVKGYVTKYQEEVKSFDTADERNVILQKYMDNIRRKGIGKAIGNLFLDMLNPETLLVNEEYKLNDYDYAFEQICV